MTVLIIKNNNATKSVKTKIICPTTVTSQSKKLRYCRQHTSASINHVMPKTRLL